MASEDRVDQPKKKLTLSFAKIKTPSQSAATSPAPQIAARKPSIKLRINSAEGPTSSPLSVSNTAAIQAKKKKAIPNRTTPGSSAKKRKQPDDDGSNDELARKPAQVRKLTLTTKPPALQSPVTPTLKLKYKGRIPKRPVGLGYDSELDEREPDPTILESFILRMLPGPDCDYVREAVEHGTIGVARSQGGADVQLKFYDRAGRRSIVTIRGQRWAATLVDLPCIVEGMKSWDKKGWVKSADICQMLLVLGKVQTEDEAREYPLPAEVNPSTWQYAHGLTPPMRWVRKRRFARTNRTSVNAIEAIERKVTQLLAEDDLAVHTKFELLDRDPETRQAANYGFESEEALAEDFGVEEDAEGDEVDAEIFGEPDGSNGTIETPAALETPTEQADEDIDDDFILSGLMEADDKPIGGPATAPPAVTSGSLGVELDTPTAIESTSPSVVETAAQTPAAAETSGADDETDESEADDDDDESMDEEDREAAAQKQKALDEIQELKEELKKQMTVLKNQQNRILRQKIMTRIEQIEGDLETARKTAGLDVDAEDGAEDD
jgi:transcription initiation factor TFIID subunit 7